MGFFLDQNHISHHFHNFFNFCTAPNIEYTHNVLKNEKNLFCVHCVHTLSFVYFFSHIRLIESNKKYDDAHIKKFN